VIDPRGGLIRGNAARTSPGAGSFGTGSLHAQSDRFYARQKADSTDPKSG
jgi:hypothetical protein